MCSKVEKLKLKLVIAYNYIIDSIILEQYIFYSKPDNNNNDNKWNTKKLVGITDYPNLNFQLTLKLFLTATAAPFMDLWIKVKIC